MIIMESFHADNVLSHLSELDGLYHRLLIIAAPSGSGKTIVLKELHNKQNWPYINVNYELSKRLLTLSQKQRKLLSRDIMVDIIEGLRSKTLLLDNIELLFSKELALNPLTLLKQIARNYTLIVAWNGTISDGHLIYAEPNHHEYLKDSVQDILVLSKDAEKNY